MPSGLNDANLPGWPNKRHEGFVDFTHDEYADLNQGRRGPPHPPLREDVPMQAPAAPMTASESLSRVNDARRVNDRLCAAIHTLIDLNASNRALLTGDGLGSGMAAAFSLREFHTVSLDVGRRVGKSTAINRLARPFDTVVVGRPQLAMFAQESKGLVVIAQDDRSWQFARERLLSGLIQQHKAMEGLVNAPIVYVDEPSLCGDGAMLYSRITRLYGAVAPTVVLLGTQGRF